METAHESKHVNDQIKHRCSITVTSKHKQTPRL